MGVTKDVQRFISADSTIEQQKIWASKLRWVLLNPVMRTVLASPSVDLVLRPVILRSDGLRLLF